MSESDAGASKSEVESDQTPSVPHTAEQVGPSRNITTALANAGHTLDAVEAELVLNPLRLAFETKNVKVIELALDCLHVRPCCLSCYLTFKST